MVMCSRSNNTVTGTTTYHNQVNFPDVVIMKLVVL